MVGLSMSILYIIFFAKTGILCLHPQYINQFTKNKFYDKVSVKMPV